MSGIAAVKMRVTDFGHTLAKLPSRVKARMSDFIATGNPFSAALNGFKKLSERKVDFVAPQDFRTRLESSLSDDTQKVFEHHFGHETASRVLEMTRKQHHVQPGQPLTFEKVGFATRAAYSLMLEDAAKRKGVTIPDDWPGRQIVLKDLATVLAQDNGHPKERTGRSDEYWRSKADDILNRTLRQHPVKEAIYAWNDTKAVFVKHFGEKTALHALNQVWNATGRGPNQGLRREDVALARQLAILTILNDAAVRADLVLPEGILTDLPEMELKNVHKEDMSRPKDWKGRTDDDWAKKADQVLADWMGLLSANVA